MKRRADADDEVSKRLKVEASDEPEVCGMKLEATEDQAAETQEATEAEAVLEHAGEAHVDDGSQYVTQEVIQPEVTTVIEQGDIQVSDGTEVVTIDTTESQILHIQTEDEILTTENGEVVATTEHDGVASVTEDAQVFETIQEEAIPQTEEAEAALDQELQPAPQFQNIIVQHMNIAAPLNTLQKLLESRLQCSLADHEFWLQDTHKLDASKNLVSQCVQGSGMVQINVEVKSQPGIKPRLNIVDILKPAEEVVEMPEDTVQAVIPSPEPAAPTASPAPTKVVIPFPEESENVTRWIVDQSFRRDMDRLKIPTDPALWNSSHVRHWIQWAVKEFSLENVNIDDFKMTGPQLCALRHDEFSKYIPSDKGDIFWTHLELLRKCKFVAVIQQPTPHAITTITVSTSGGDFTPQKSFNRQKARSFMLSTERISPGNRTGNNGQIQLWQFLLELLTDKDCREVIQWVGDDGEFKLNNPEVVAQMWGQRKNKPTMNYEKLSRALRYYYDGDMIAKVHGKRFVYKFVCDLRMLLGYNAAELNRLVTECAEKKLQRVRETLRPTILKKGGIEIEAK